MQTIDHDAWLRAHPDTLLRIAQLRIDIEALKESPPDEADAIEGAVMRGRAGVSAIHVSGVSDPTTRIATRTATEYTRELNRLTRELRELERRAQRVEAWLAWLPARERLVVKLYYIDRQPWPVIATRYADVYAPSDGRSVTIRTVQRVKQTALQLLEKGA